MIRLDRIRSKEAIHSSFRGKTPQKRLRDLMAAVRDHRAANTALALKFDSKWSVVKDQLLTESFDKCAYCETATKVVAFGDVEHYRPKSVYWWLAYVYDNYLASCAVCNQLFKSNHFECSGVRMAGPTIEASTTDAEFDVIGPAAIPDPLDALQVQAFIDLHRLEEPLIPNPYFDDPEAIFAWDVLDGTKEVEVIPQPGIPRAPAIVDAAERLYGLNRPELKRLRYKQYEFYRLARAAADSPGIDPAIRTMSLELITSMVQPDSQYAGMIRYFEKNR
ncbi:hypothetical protein LXM94_11685 [Rhizobium sp. TRM95111]|uniref:hypothetical protein n=1 Tax=Rhizobium alarense TaxID=2846851 RepID=UPI001F42C1B3|nr:hypothetical protein [Rhizobium alarense]MCF3640626.1 hypothetical protein [Rhizobium alarense]